MSEQYQIETRQTHPSYRFETRTFHCPDKVTRLVTLHSGMWHRFEKAHRVHSLEKTISLCTELSLRDDPYNHSFSDILHYWLVVHADFEAAECEGRGISYNYLYEYWL